MEGQMSLSTSWTMKHITWTFPFDNQHGLMRFCALALFAFVSQIAIELQQKNAQNSNLRNVHNSDLFRNSK